MLSPPALSPPSLPSSWTLAPTTPGLEYGLPAFGCPSASSTSKSKKEVWGVRGSMNRDCKDPGDHAVIVWHRLRHRRV